MIEDDPQQTKIFNQALLLTGFIVEACSDGKNALDHLDDAAPYLVILYLNLQ
jgi:DNA-binding response OmpR family regulator